MKTYPCPRFQPGDIVKLKDVGSADGLLDAPYKWVIRGITGNAYQYETIPTTGYTEIHFTNIVWMDKNLDLVEL